MHSTASSCIHSNEPTSGIWHLILLGGCKQCDNSMDHLPGEPFYDVLHSDLPSTLV